MARDVHDVRGQTILREYAEARAERTPRDIIILRAVCEAHQDNEKQRWQHRRLMW